MKSFWITNISQNLISLGDLGVLLQPYQSVNLMDPKHYSFTIEQINLSLQSGSLYKRSDKVKVRKFPPSNVGKKLYGQNKIEIDTKNQYPSKIRSLMEHKEYNYDEDESQISDEEYAKINYDLALEEDLGKYKK